MRLKKGLCAIAIAGAVLMGGPVAAFGKTTVDCSTTVIRIERNEVDVNKQTINEIRTLARTTSSSQTSYINRSLPVKVCDLIDRASEKLGINPQLVRAVAMTESRGNQEAVSPAGAIGVMQLMPGTARGLGVNPYDLEQNIFGGCMYLKRQIERYQGSIPLALAAYNAGPGAVDKYRGVPPFKETREYIADVMSLMGRV